MRIETADGTTKVWVRQSWLNDVMICPERARLGLERPDWRQSSDATHIGTAVHRGIEHILLGYEGNPIDTASRELERLMETEPFKVNSTNGPGEMREFVPALMQAFQRDILPSVETGPGSMVEQNFGVKLYETDRYDDRLEVWLGGTVDYVDPNGVLWDWKTAARRYSQGEKQRQAIQASAYAYAARELGWSQTNPIRFNYGVITRTSKPAGQIVPVVRSGPHVDWFKSQVESVVSMALTLGMGNRWMTNDQHGLCSEKWCPFWSICKGSHISDLDNHPEEG